MTKERAAELVEVQAIAEAFAAGETVLRPRDPNTAYRILIDDNKHYTIIRTDGRWTEPRYQGSWSAEQIVRMFEPVPKSVVLSDETVSRAITELEMLRGENRQLRSALQTLSEHEPSWSDDFLRARAALIGVLDTLAGKTAPEQ